LQYLAHDLLDRFEIDIRIKLNPVTARDAHTGEKAKPR
jgi:hypothetical protein